jgi:hypothetical protein
MLDGILDSGKESPTQYVKRTTRAWLIRYAEYAPVDHQFTETPVAAELLKAENEGKEARAAAEPPNAYNRNPDGTLRFYPSYLDDMRWRSPRNKVLGRGDTTTEGRRRHHEGLNILDMLPEFEFIGNGDIPGATINKRAKKGEPILFRGDTYLPQGDLDDTRFFFTFKGITKEVDWQAADRFHAAWAKRAMRSPELAAAWQAKRWDDAAILIALDEAFAESGMKF